MKKPQAEKSHKLRKTTTFYKKLLDENISAKNDCKKAE